MEHIDNNNNGRQMPLIHNERDESEKRDSDMSVVTLKALQDDINKIWSEVNKINYRNNKKDEGKEFEGSYTRVFFIMFLTYGTLCGYMYIIGVQHPYLNAIVPTVGFNLSTWSLSTVKKIWIKLKYSNNEASDNKNAFSLV